MTEALLRISGLKTHFDTELGVVKAVDGVDFEVHPGEVFGLVGESGCGKSVTARSIMRLIPWPGRIVAGEIHFDGLNLLELPERQIRKIRGSRISMIFQEPQASLNPVFNIGSQVAEIFQIHQGLSREEAWRKAVELLKTVGMPDPNEKGHAYPHEISGGQAQRVMIATALALNPQLLIADEPTTALDVTIQAQILDLIRKLTRERNTAVILITHDLGVVAEMCDRVAVMYAGRILEQTNTLNLFDRPLHPYTQGLISSLPVLGQVKERLETIPGNVPELVGMRQQCRFADRCLPRQERDMAICEQREPSMIEAEEAHWVRCWLYESPVELTALPAESSARQMGERLPPAP